MMSAVQTNNRVDVGRSDSTRAGAAADGQLLQPALLIGLGDFGRRISDELERRTAIAQQFRSTHGRLLAQALPMLLLPGPQADAATAAAWHLQSDDDLREAARAIGRRFALIRAAQVPAGGVVRPTIIVVGACWEPAGAAFWRLAALIRTVLSYAIDYQLIGIFVTAQWLTPESEEDAREVELGDALSCAVLEAGDRQLVTAPAFLQQISTVLGVRPDEPERLLAYDWSYLLDSERADGSAVAANNNSYEIENQTVTLVETLLYGRFSQALDQLLLDEYAVMRDRQRRSALPRQVYLSVGFASLLVPLREIGEKVVRRVTARLIDERILPAQRLSPTDELQVETLSSLLLHRLAEQQVERWNERLAEQGDYSLDSGRRGRYRARLTQDGSTVRVAALKLRAENIAGEDDSLRAHEVLRRLNAEADEGEHYLQRAAQIAPFDTDLYDEPIARLIGATLQSGDAGLQRAISIFEALLTRLSTAVSAATAAAGAAQKTLNRLEQQQQEIGRAFFIDRRLILDSALRTRGRLTAVLVRSALLFVLLYQLYYDALRSDVAIWPIAVVWPGRETYDISLLDPLASLLLGSVVLLFVLLAFLPPLAIAWHIARERRRRQQILIARLTVRLATQRRMFLDELVYLLRDFRLPLLVEQRDALRGYVEYVARQSAAAPDQPPLHNEIWVVSPADVGALQQIEAADAARVEIGTQLFAGWLANPAAQRWELHSAQGLTQLLETQVRRLVEFDAMRPVESYLTPQVAAAALSRLEPASAPWAAVAPSLLPLDDAAAHQVHAVSFLAGATVESAAPDGLLQELQRGRQRLAWLDRYRIALISVLGGITTDNLARMAQLRLRSRLSAGDGSALQAAAQPLDRWRHAAPRLAQLLGALTMQQPDGALRRGFALAADSLVRLLQRVGDVPVDEITAAAAELDRLRETELLPRPLRRRLDDWYSEFDRWLLHFDLVPVTPPAGVIYDPTLHGIAVATLDAGRPDDEIVRRIRRGYQQYGRLLVEPEVAVNRRKG